MMWMAYASNSGITEAHMDGCALALTPMLLLENANALGKVAGEVNKVGAEVSAGRTDNRKASNSFIHTLITLARFGSTQLQGRPEAEAFDAVASLPQAISPKE